VAAEIRTPDNVDGAFQALASERLDVVIVLQTSMLLSERQKIAHVWQRLHPSSQIIIRTHKQRLTNKRELLFCSNHWRRASLVHR
jgi:hypothetical protein